MSDLEGYIAIGCYELGNVARTTTYGRGLFFSGCDCLALEEDYGTVTGCLGEGWDSGDWDDGFWDDDIGCPPPAPWYDQNHPQSADFLGFLPGQMTLSVPASRQTTDVLGEGSVVGPEKLPGRVLEVTGWLTALSPAAMYWGKRWLTEAARGSMCKDGCSGDVLDVLTVCRDDCPDGDCSGDFRFMVGAALVDGPRFNEVQADACGVVVEAQMQFASTMPYLYHPAVQQVGAQAVAAEGSACTLISTDTWMDGEALVITVQSPEDAAASDLTVTVTFSLDGTCPETRVPASVTYTIPDLPRSASLTVDATRRQVRYHNPTSKRDEPGFAYIDFDGAFCWPILPACSQLCVCLENGGTADVEWSVTRYAREL